MADRGPPASPPLSHKSQAYEVAFKDDLGGYTVLQKEVRG